jgi:hypothetical protein
MSAGVFRMLQQRHKDRQNRPRPWSASDTTSAPDFRPVSRSDSGWESEGASEGGWDCIAVKEGMLVMGKKMSQDKVRTGLYPFHCRSRNYATPRLSDEVAFVRPEKEEQSDWLV